MRAHCALAYFLYTFLEFNAVCVNRRTSIMEQTATYQKLNNAGMKAGAAGDRVKAELLFTQAVSIDGSNISAYMNLVSCHLSGRAFNKALNSLGVMRKKCNPAQLALVAAGISGFEALASDGIKKRCLLVSLGNTFEGRLFALSFIDFFGRINDSVLDVAMPTHDCFLNLEPSVFSYGNRLPVEQTVCFDKIAGNKYDAIVFADFPETGFLDLFCRLLAVKGPKKYLQTCI